MKKFRIYPKRGRDQRYFLVYVCRTREQMHYHRRRMEARFGEPSLGNDWEACATWWEHMGPLCCGIAMFYLGHAGARTVSHELGHLNIYWFNRTINGFDWEEIPEKKAAEEEFCYVLGDLTREFYVQWWQRCDPWEQALGPIRRNTGRMQ